MKKEVRRLENVIRSLAGDDLNRWSKTAKESELAIVVAVAPDSIGSDILTHLGAAVSTRLILRINSIDLPKAEVIESISSKLENELASADKENEAFELEFGPRKAANLLSFAPKSLEVGVLSQLQAYSPEDAKEIKEQMFLFEDLSRLSKAALRIVCDEASDDTVRLALVGATEKEKDAFWQDHSRLCRVSASNSNPEPKSIEAKKKLVEIALRLEAEGKIMIYRQKGPIHG